MTEKWFCYACQNFVDQTDVIFVDEEPGEFYLDGPIHAADGGECVPESELQDRDHD